MKNKFVVLLVGFFCFFPFYAGNALSAEGKKEASDAAEPAVDGNVPVMSSENYQMTGRFTSGMGGVLVVPDHIQPSPPPPTTEKRKKVNNLPSRFRSRLCSTKSSISSGTFLIQE